MTVENISFAMASRILRPRVIVNSRDEDAGCDGRSIRAQADTFSARRPLEDLVVERVAARPEPATIRKLRAHVQSEVVARNKGQRREAIRMAGEFHMTLARLSGSRELQATLEPVLLQSSLIVSMYGGGLMPSCPVKEHQAIVDAIEQGDAARASDLMKEHLTHLEGTLRLEVEDKEPTSLLFFNRRLRPVIKHPAVVDKPDELAPN